VRRKLDDGSGEDLGRQFERLDWMAAWLADVSLRDLSRGEYFIVTAWTGNSTRGGGEKSNSCGGCSPQPDLE
jgi:hypothetical protein